MAPLANDPGQILIVLNLAKRKALYTLITEITQYMRSQVKLNIPQQQQSPNQNSQNNHYGHDAPLFVANSPSRHDHQSNTNSPGEDNNNGSSSNRPTPSAAPFQRSLSAPPPTPELIQVRRAALAHFDAWQTDLLTKLKELLTRQDDAAILVDRRERANRLARQRADLPSPGESLIDFGGADRGKLAAEQERVRDVARLQLSYHPLPTRLTTLSVEDREETLSCVLLLLLAAGRYTAESRTLAVYLASALGLPIGVLNAEEGAISRSLIEKSTSEEAQQRMSADAEAEKRKQENQKGRYWKVGIASVAGAAVIGLTGGLAAPVVAGAIGGIMGSVGLGGVASFLGVFWMNGALVGALFGAFGGKMTGEMIDKYAREVRDFRFIPLRGPLDPRFTKENKEDRRLRVTVGVNGWLASENDITGPWQFLGDDSEVFALRYEVECLMGLGQSLKDLVSSTSWNFVKAEILKRTVLATLWSALWPAYLLSAAAGVDNPFSLAKNRSEKAGEILADAIINKVQGERPITLIGYSLGARAIYSCLRSLAARRAFGLVDTVVFIGAPVPSNPQHWQLMRSVVSGKIHNVYSENDYLLAFLYRATSIQLGIAGLQPIKGVEGVENVNLSEEVQGHMRYAENIPQILARCGFPVVEGAAKPIEKEQEISLEDLESAPKTGTLIDFGDLTISDSVLPPSKPAQKAPSAFPGQGGKPHQQKKLTRPTMSKMTPSVGHGDLLSLRDGGETQPRGSSVVSQFSRTVSAPAVTTTRQAPSSSSPVISSPKSIPVQQQSHPQPGPSHRTIPDQPKPATPPARDEKTPNVKPVTTAPTLAVLPSKEAAASAPVLTSSHDYNVHEDNDDEDYGGGIKMLDNEDGDFEYLDPTPIENEDEDDDFNTWVK